MFKSISSGSCGSGKAVRYNGSRAPVSRPSYFNQVLEKARNVQRFESLSDQQLSERVQELTDEKYLWSVYFSGIVLDPTREHIEKALEEAPTGESSPLPVGKFIKLLFKPVRGGGQYGVNSLTSLLLQRYGAIDASILVGGAVVLRWETFGLVIPTGKPVEPVSGSAAEVLANSQASVTAAEHTITEEVLLHDFETTLNKKEQVDKLITVIQKYNRLYSYHPVRRNCQKFVSDCLTALKQTTPPALVGDLTTYFDSIKKGRRKKNDFESHAELDAFVDEYLKSSGGTRALETEYLLGQYFLLHVTSMTDSGNPGRWACQVPTCHMPRLEQTIELQDTVAYRSIHQ